MKWFPLLKGSRQLPGAACGTRAVICAVQEVRRQQQGGAVVKVAK